MFGEIFSNADAACFEFEEFNVTCRRSCTEDKSDWCFFARLMIVLIQPVQVELDLTLVGGLKLPQFEVNYYKPAKFPGLEEQIDKVVLAITRKK